MTNDRDDSIRDDSITALARNFAISLLPRLSATDYRRDLVAMAYAAGVAKGADLIRQRINETTRKGKTTDA